ncbi:MAG: glycosyltransferase family 2 protein [Planctomycetota bacterium]
MTVVLPVRNEEAHVGGTLARILAQDYPGELVEVLVVDGRSGDRTREVVLEIAERHPNVRLLDNPRRLPSSGRNVGFREGRGDIFVVIDGHSYIEDDQLLRNIVREFEETGADCLGRPQPLDPPGITPFQRAVALARASPLGHSTKSHIYSNFRGFVSPVSCAAVYRRRVFERVGYVDEDFDACEDVEFNYRIGRAGLTCYLSPTFRVRYYPRDTLGKLFRQMLRYGRGRARFLAKHPEATNFDTLVPPVFVLGLLALPVAWGLSKPVGLALGALYGLYALGVFVQAAWLGIARGPWNLLYGPPILLAIHAGLGLGFLGGLARILFARISGRRPAPG